MRGKRRKKTAEYRGEQDKSLAGSNPAEIDGAGGIEFREKKHTWRAIGLPVKEDTTLAATKATKVTYFMDACFTGANKEGSMLVAARGVAREAKKEKLDGNAVVFSASSADETAMTYPEKGHGLFTYFLLKKLQETSGDVTYDELAGCINKNVRKEAFLINEKPQTPVVATSPKATSSWKSMKLK